MRVSFAKAPIGGIIGLEMITFVHRASGKRLSDAELLLADLAAAESARVSSRARRGMTIRE